MDLLRLLHAVRHGMASKETAASSYLAIIFGRIASGVPLFLCSTAEPMQHPHQCMHLCRLW